MTLAAVGVDVGPQYSIHARQMPVALLLKPLQNVTIDAKMHGRFAWRHYNACTLPEFRIFLWAFGRIGAGLVFAPRDLLLNFCQRISYGSRFFGHACWPSCADDVNRSVVRSGVNNSVHRGLNVPERHVPQLAVVLTIIDRFDDFILEDQGSPQERDLVVLDVGSVLVFMPGELQHPHLVILVYTFVYTYQRFSECPTRRLRGITSPSPGRRDGRNLAQVDAVA